MASPGYGKRSAPGQLPLPDRPFPHLPGREAAIAAYIDRLPDGADISVKTLAKVVPAYGQCAIRTALRNLTAAGHLRRGSEHLAGEGSQRWVTRTWFTRTARDDAWWAAYATGKELPQARPTRSRAFILLAALSRTAPALTLSAADCAALEPLAATWFERGATEAELTHALTTGLPTPVHHAASLTRTRLLTKLPPDRTPRPTPRVLRVLECVTCGDPGRPEALTGGECGPCRNEAPAPRPAALTPAEVRAHAARARTASRTPERTRT
ncbi:hypothetical protein ACFPK5_17430 [Streptomyces beijiangensis]